MNRAVGCCLFASILVLGCSDDGPSADASVTVTDASSEGGSSSGNTTMLPTTTSSVDTSSSEGSSSTDVDTSTSSESTSSESGSGSSSEESSSSGAVDLCGNDMIDGDEACDGTDLAGLDCAAVLLGSGPLVCQPDCSGFDSSLCVTCGDGVATDPEPCDLDDLQGATCVSQGFENGTIACAGNCLTFDTSGCGLCGNAVGDGDEPCDGDDLRGETCETQGFDYGELSCIAACGGFDVTLCGECGDGSIGGDESCDGDDLGGASCMSLGLGDGQLGCQASCAYDYTDCETQPVYVVDFPTAADARFTASGTLPWNGGDWFEGLRDTPLASISQVDIHLEIVSNGLTECGFQEAEVSINDVAIGTFTVAEGTTVIDQSFPVMPSILGPGYTIRYETTTTVEGGCGAAGYDEVGSTVTFYGG